MIEHTCTKSREELSAELERVKAQRDELLKAAEYLRDRWIDDSQDPYADAPLVSIIAKIEASK